MSHRQIGHITSELETTEESRGNTPGNFKSYYRGGLQHGYTLSEIRKIGSRLEVLLISGQENQIIAEAIRRGHKSNGFNKISSEISIYIEK